VGSSRPEQSAEPAADNSAVQLPQDYRSALLHPEDYRAQLLRPFYDLLNEHPQCADDLDMVLTQSRLFHCPDDRGRWLPIVRHPVVWPVARWFAVRWHLPKDHGVDDLDSTIILALNGYAPLQLDIGARGGTVPTIGHTADELRAAGVEPPSDGDDRWPLICLPRLDPIRYDAARLMSGELPATIRRTAREYARRVEHSILDQARAFEVAAEAAGYRVLPAHFRTPEQRHHAALRLYRRVIEGRTWVQIADAEAVEGKSNPEQPQAPDAVRQTATRLAKELTIPVQPLGLTVTTGILERHS
jgi:hypothetical protein